jgi:5'-methylthioadenosine phosphorylase
MSADTPVGVIGGSGFYSLLDDPEQHDVETPYGAPSSTVTLGSLAGRTVAFIPRHGKDHRFAPHVVPYRANLWALRSLGVRQVVSLSAVGSLTTSLPTGTIVVPDQLADRTAATTRILTRATAWATHPSPTRTVRVGGPRRSAARSRPTTAARSWS